MMPRAKMEKRSKLPPEKRLMMPKTPPWAVRRNSWILSRSTPGVGMKAPRR